MSCPQCRPPGPRSWAVFIALLVAMLLAATVFAAATPPLSLEEASRLALERQPQLDAQSAAIAALREEAVAARQLPDPKLIVGVEGLPTDSFSLTRQEMTQTVLGLSQMIPGGDKRALAGRRIEQQAGREEWRLQADRRRLAREAGLAWLEAYVPTAALDLARRIVDEYDHQAEWSRVAYQTGLLAQDETLALRAMQESARNRVAELAGQRRRGQAALARWIGPAAQRPLAPLAGRVVPLPLDALTAKLDDHPELRAAKAGLETGRTDLEMARQASRPDWSVDVAYGIRGQDRPDTLKVMVGVDLPLFPENRQDRRLAARRAEVAQMEAMLEDQRRMLAADLAMAHADWWSADERLGRLEKDILPLAGRRVESALAAYTSGRGGYDRVLEARRAELEARLEQLDLEMARTRAAVMLRYYE